MTTKNEQKGFQLPEGVDRDQYFEKFARFLKVFSSSRRLAIITSISFEAKNVGTIAKELGLSSQVISQNLAVLTDKGAVVASKEGKYTYYRCSHIKLCAGITSLSNGFYEMITGTHEQLSASEKGQTGSSDYQGIQNLISTTNTNKE